ncbi:hypothetical protein D9M72_647790 [compost metagenome]
MRLDEAIEVEAPQVAQHDATVKALAGVVRRIVDPGVDLCQAAGGAGAADVGRNVLQLRTGVGVQYEQMAPSVAGRVVVPGCEYHHPGAVGLLGDDRIAEG